jgi:hypothetical protein
LYHNAVLIQATLLQIRILKKKSKFSVFHSCYTLLPYDFYISEASINAIYRKRQRIKNHIQIDMLIMLRK